MKLLCSCNTPLSDEKYTTPPGLQTALWATFASHSKTESFRFYMNEYDDEYEILSMLSSVRAWNSVILAGKRGSRRRSPSSFSVNIVVAETSYQMLEILSCCYRERA